MELYQLRSFGEIARTGNLTRAASNLNLSQSALSSQIRQLEDELGLALFLREARGMRLSPEGEKLLPLAGEVLGRADHLSRTARTLGGRGLKTLKIGFNTDGPFLKAGQISRLLGQRLPGTHCVFVSSQTIRTREMLRQGIIDLGFFFGTYPDSDIASWQISRCHVRIVVPETLLISETMPDWHGLAALPWIWSVSDCPYYQVLQAELDRIDLQPNIVVEAMDESVIRELVRDGVGAAILREDEAMEITADGSVRLLPVYRFEIPLCIGMLAVNRGEPDLMTVVDLVSRLWQEKGERRTSDSTPPRLMDVAG